MTPPLPPAKARLALRIAIAADVLQVALLPFLLAPPVYEAIDAALDVAVGITMCVLLRPHWAFAPAFAAELLPVVDVVPFWTLAVKYVTRAPALPEVGVQGVAAPPDGPARTDEKAP